MKSPLQELTGSDLSALAEAIRSGRVAFPFTPLSIQRYCSEADADAVADELQKFTEEGASAELIARVAEMLAQERTNHSGAEDSIDLVLTGPEVPGATFRDTGVVLRELFSSAKESVVVAGYAVYQGKEVFRALAERMTEVPDLRVQMFLDVQRKYGDSTEELELVRQFAHRFRSKDWPGEIIPEVYYDPRSLDLNKKKRSSLHAKCVVVDQQMAFISSANFTEAAQVRNIEVGVLIRSKHSAEKLARHFQALAEAGVLKPLLTH